MAHELTQVKKKTLKLLVYVKKKNLSYYCIQVAAELTQVKLASPIARQRGRRHVIREKKISCLHRLFY